MSFKKGIVPLLFTTLFLTIFAFSLNAQAISKKDSAINKARAELYATNPHYKKIKISATYEKTKKGTEYISFFENNKYTYHQIDTYKFSKKYGHKRLYKYDFLTASYKLVKVYSLSAGKNSKALSNQKANTLLKKIKIKGKQGKTLKTKNLKVGTSYSNVRKQLGKPKKITIPYTNVAYNYNSSRVFFDSKFGTTNWIIDKAGSVRMTQVYQPKNQFLTYGQIKKQFGTSKLVYDRTLGLHFIRYNFGKYTINFASDRFTGFAYQSSVDIIQLNNNLKFNSYFVVSTK